MTLKDTSPTTSIRQIIDIPAFSIYTSACLFCITVSSDKLWEPSIAFKEVYKNLKSMMQCPTSLTHYSF